MDDSTFLLIYKTPKSKPTECIQKTHVMMWIRMGRESRANEMQSGSEIYLIYEIKIGIFSMYLV